MSDDLDFDTMVLDDYPDLPEIRYFPGGKCLVTVDSVERITARTGSNGFLLKCSVEEALGGQDMEGVNLSKTKIYHRIYAKTENGVSAMKRDFFKIAPDLQGKKMLLPELAENLVGRSFVADTILSKNYQDGTPRDYPELQITRNGIETYG